MQRCYGLQEERKAQTPALDLEERARSPLALSATNRHRRRHATCNTNEPHVLCGFTSFLGASTRSGDLYAWELCKCEYIQESLQT